MLGLPINVLVIVSPSSNPAIYSKGYPAFFFLGFVLQFYSGLAQDFVGCCPHSGGAAAADNVIGNLLRSTLEVV